jgi:hypothetical protein
MAKSKPNKNSETAKKREAGSRLVVTGKPTVRREGETVIVSVPIKVYRLNGRQMILSEGSKTEEAKAPKALNVPLITSIAKAWLWQDQLESGKYNSIDEIAAANNVDRTHVSRILQLTSLSPTIVEQILEGKEPEGMSLRQLRKGIPLLWSEQGVLPQLNQEF